MYGCPFFVLVLVDLPPLIKARVKAVIAVKQADNLVEVYTIE